MGIIYGQYYKTGGVLEAPSDLPNATVLQQEVPLQPLPPANTSEDTVTIVTMKKARDSNWENSIVTVEIVKKDQELSQ